MTVVAAFASKPTVLILDRCVRNSALSEADVLFMSADAYGMCGAAFADLLDKYEYIVEQPATKDGSREQEEAVAGY